MVLRDIRRRARKHHDPNRLKASSCIATLDYAARTLTFVHRGMFRSKPQKASPVIVPFDEITSVDYDWDKSPAGFASRVVATSRGKAVSPATRTA
jgi:hypothetical protein